MDVPDSLEAEDILAKMVFLDMTELLDFLDQKENSGSLVYLESKVVLVYLDLLDSLVLLV